MMMQVPVDKIVVDKRYNEMVFADDDKELLNSMRSKGLEKPIKVARLGDKYLIIDGRLRLFYAKVLKWKNIFADILLPVDDTPIELVPSEHRIRTRLGDMRHYIKRIMEKNNLSKEEMAAKMNRDVEWLEAILWEGA